MESFESLDNELEKNPLLDWEPMEGLEQPSLGTNGSESTLVTSVLRIFFFSESFNYTIKHELLIINLFMKTK